MVVSLVGLFNRVIHESLTASGIRAPFVTILIDLADYPPHFWIERQKQYLIVGSKKAKYQALAAGYDPASVFQASGMIIHPNFYDEDPVAPQELAESLVQDQRITGIVSFGGYGGTEMVRIAKRLSRLRDKLQCVFVCGHNRNLKRRIERLTQDHFWHVVGFTDRMPFYLRTSDFFIGKPGSISLCEAVRLRVPVITTRSWRTMPQERYPADWIRELSTGLVLKSFRRIDRAVEELLQQPGALDRFRRNLASVEIRAVLEIPSILEEILERERPSPSL